MTRYISLLRGINVSGQKKIKMAELKAMYEALGWTEVVTYIQSGNVLFTTKATRPEELINRIREQIKITFGFEVKVFVYVATDFEQAIQANPFLPKPPEDFKKLHLTFLSELPSEVQLASLADFQSGTDEFQFNGQFIYLYCPDGYGRTKLSNNFFERKLKVSATTRNWNSVLKLHALVNA